MLQKYEERLIDIKKMLQELGTEVTMASERALGGIENLDVSRFESARAILKNTETIANAIDNEIVVTLALFGPEARDLRKMVAYLKITNEILLYLIGSKCAWNIHNAWSNGVFLIHCKEQIVGIVFRISI